jgi:hypothetical protein
MFLLKAVRHRGSASRLINDWYPEKVNQAFSTGETAVEQLFAGFGNRVAFHPAKS